jgi:hypothetical protein
MDKVVSNPIPLRAGRWSISSRSKGNFVYSFDGCIPFNIISSYKHILLSPFLGSGQLRPSLGWTHLLAHGVPTGNERGGVTDTDTLLEEARTMPGLNKAVFAMPPRWLKPPGSISTDYSSITFAISNPNSSITSELLNGRAAMFGKEVRIQKWINKPTLVQCSHCHALGHNKASKACRLSKESVKCHICGGAHASDTHDQHCCKQHAVAGLCDCSHYKCLNCQKMGHNARDVRCPARELYCPCTPRKPTKNRDKGKDKEINTDSEQSALNPFADAMHDQYDYLFNPPFDPNPPDNGQQTLDGEPTPASLEMEIDSLAANITGWDNESSQKAAPP